MGNFFLEHDEAAKSKFNKSDPEDNFFLQYDQQNRGVPGDVEGINQGNAFLQQGEQLPSNTPAPVDPVVKQFQDMPWYQQGPQALDDLTRLFSTGAMYGSDTVIGGEETAKLNDEARRRSGIPGVISELGGGLASPATRLIGAGAKALTPVGKGIWNWLAKAAVTSGEGATIGATGAVLSGRPEDAYKDATWGAVLPHAIKAGGKAITAPTKFITAFAANRAAKHYTNAFRAGHTGNPNITQAFREGINRKPKTVTGRGTQHAYESGRALSQGKPSHRAIIDTFKTLPFALGAGAMYHPMLAATPAIMPIVGSPRLGGGVAHAAGTVMGGLDMLASKGQLPALLYEQKKRRENRGKK